MFDDLEVKVWRTFTGHGGNVICVRFSPSVGEVVCSTATDRQARIWSVYSSECLYVLDHDSIVTTCGFSADCSLLAVGCLDKTLWLWKLPQQLVKYFKSQFNMYFIKYIIFRYSNLRLQTSSSAELKPLLIGIRMM